MNLKPVWLRLIPYIPYIAAALLATSGLAYVGKSIYDRGYASSTRKWEQKIAAESARVDQANAAAKEAGRMLLAGYLKKLEVRDAEISKILAEAKDNPDAGSKCMPADLMRRLNRLR